MPRFRSLSTNTHPHLTPPLNSTSRTPTNHNQTESTSPSSPAFLIRGFRSLRRLHRQPSQSMPSSPDVRRTGSTSAFHMPLSTSLSAASSTSSLSSDRPESAERQGGSPPSTLHIRLVPNVGLSNRCFVFEVIERDLKAGVVIKIGRYSDRNLSPERLSFKSKVVSRSHAELWAQDNKLYIRDVGSSSGTFVNRGRLSPAGVRSSAHELKDGDVIQLGVDYQGGIETMYRAVRIRLEINREPNVSQPFSRAAFQQLRQHLLSTNITAAATSDHESGESHHGEESDVHHSTDRSQLQQKGEVQECCICLYAIAPLQALFITPCTHIFHFKCIRPLVLQNYPGFSCPICRSYSNLEANVAIEVSDIMVTLSVEDKPPETSNEQGLEEAQDGQPPTHQPESSDLSLPSSQAEYPSPSLEPASTTSTKPSHVGTQSSGTGAHLNIRPQVANEGVLSTTLIGSPPTFEEILTASSGSPA